MVLQPFTSTLTKESACEHVGGGPGGRVGRGVSGEVLSVGGGRVHLP